jgi:Putative  PD-(D/E)XK family member, (DUF4420)
MNFQNLSIETWKQLDTTGNVVSGYKSVFLELADHCPSKLHIFIDESGKHHFAIEDPNVSTKFIEDPRINGLHIKIRQYRMKETDTATFIDICCYIEGFLEIFTQVIKEISKKILVDKDSPVESVIVVIRKWKTFWAQESKPILTEDQQIGLICELLVLSKLCIVDSSKALSSWRGPLGEIHDFIFKDWSFEIKATRRGDRIHRINGIDQLNPLPMKKLMLFSFLVSVSTEINSICLQSIVDEFINNVFRSSPELIIKFAELMRQAGYSPVFG